MVLLLLCWTSAGAEQPIPRLSARVTDLTRTLEPVEREALEARLAAFEREKGTQIAVLIVATTAPETIEQYGIRAAEAWKIGRKGIDDGVILLVAKNDRKLRIEVGYGLEGALPDASANRIIEEIIVPRFQHNDFYGGISAGVESIIGVIKGEPLPAPSKVLGTALQGGSGWVILAAVVTGVLLALAVLIWSATGLGLGGGTVLFLISSLVSPPLSIILVVIAVILFWLSVGGRSEGYWSTGDYGGGFGSSGGGFGGGGFSGGGGGFGGGGASGSW